MRKRIISMLVCVIVACAAVFMLLPNVTQAASDHPFAAESVTAIYCEGCGSDIPIESWTAIGGTQTQTLATEGGKHYYLSADLTGSSEVLLSGASAAGTKVCIHLNGYNITATGEDCIAISCGAGITNVLGNGTVTGTRDTASNGAAIHTQDGAQVHLYGGTYTKNAATCSAVYVGEGCGVHMYDGASIDTTGQTETANPGAVLMDKANGSFYMHGGTVTGARSTGNGGSIRVTMGTFTMDSGTISGGYTTKRGGNIAVNGGSFIMNGGLITGGEARATYGGGNVYVTDSTFDMNGGTVTLGVAAGSSYGGGNFGVFNGTLNIRGTEQNTVISAGKVNNTSATVTGLGGGNIRLEGGTVNMYGGLITGGEALDTGAKGGANIFIVSGIVDIQGGTVKDGKLANNNQYGNNIHIRNGSLTIGKAATVDYGEGVGSYTLYGYDGTVVSAGAVVGGTLYMRAGTATLTDGKYHNLNKAADATITVTGGAYRKDPAAYVQAGYQVVSNADATYVYAVIPEGETLPAAMVDSKGNEKLTQDPLTQWATGSYSYIKLYKSVDLGSLTDKVWVDLNGKDLTVAGTGTLYAFDSANDTYDTSACGTVNNNGTVVIPADVQAPNGNRYIAVTQGSRTTMHRLDVRLSAVTLRTSSMGMYYKAVYNCDTILAAKVKTYGVVLSVNNMPGSDFLTESGDINRYTVAAAEFESGVVATSGSVFGIMKTQREASVNDTYGKKEIYANPYIQFAIGEDLVVVGDAKNAGKDVSDEEFDGVAHSLFDVMNTLDDTYYSYNAAVRKQLDNFYFSWKEAGMDWNFVNIGNFSGTVDNGKLNLDGNMAYCPVCKKDVEWTALSSADAVVAMADGQHLYLTTSLTYEGTENQFIAAPGKNASACLHLNGYNLTATKAKAIFGNNGVLNVMGSGIVTGYAAKADEGGAVQINNTNAKSAINLYGGTYKKTDDSHADAGAVAIWHNGGAINLYAGVTVDCGTGNAIHTGKANYRNVELGVYGATVNGNVCLFGANPEKGFASNITVIDAKITGTLDVTANNNVTLSGTPVIGKLAVAEDMRIATKSLAAGTQIGVSAKGCFTVESPTIGNYLSYFTAADSCYRITVKNNALHCGKDYTSNLVLTDGKAVCPVCETSVEWEKIEAGDAAITLEGGKHYYLEKSQTYTGTGYAFINAPGTNKKACLHLNGNDLTATNTRAIYGSAGILNVMGTGNVSGRVNDTAGVGSTVQINAASSVGAVNLYSGTYLQADNATADEYTINLQANGGNVNVYEDAVVKSNVSGKAVRVGKAAWAKIAFRVYGAVVEGDVYTTGADQAKGFTSTVVLDNARIAGTVDINGVNAVTVAHATVIDLLDIEETSRLTLDRLTDGADITVKATGSFTEAHENASDYVAYFQPVQSADKIVVLENELAYKVIYTDKLYPDTSNMAYCPVCKKDVAWTALSSADAVVTMADGQHLYLTNSLTYEGTENQFIAAPGKNASACLHLNGYSLTATKAKAIFGNNGVLNVIGNGTVTGYTAKADEGGAVQINNTNANSAINLYGGTYKKTADSHADAGAVAIWHNGGTINLYADVTVDCGTGNAIHVGKANYRDVELGVYGATVNGNVCLFGANPEKGFASNITVTDAKITGTLDVTANNNVTLSGRPVIGKMTVASSTLITLENMTDGAAVVASADGIFTNPNDEMDNWLKYFSTTDEGKWIVVRDHALYEGTPITAEATDDDKTLLDTAYAGRSPYHGEMHDHTNTGPSGDGKNSLAQWKTEMERLQIDFATIVDHRQSVHMYHKDWDPTIFIGGTEPGTTVTDSKASQKKPHYNMLFANVEDLEAVIKAFPEYEHWDSETGSGIEFGYPKYTTARFGELAQAVYAQGGLFVHVHPKYDDYIVSSDPLDYWFADYTGLEITTGSGGNMSAKDNEEAYQLWLDLLELDKKIWATSGSDKHRLPNISALTTIYSNEKSAEAYMQYIHNGDFAPGWVGIRMAIGDATMGGETSFAGKRVIFSVGDIYNSGEVDAYNTELPYVEDHIYRAELYDDSGLLMSSIINPTQMTYFAVNCDEDAKFYRVVVWDETDNKRIGVGNPIWNQQESAE